MKRYNKFLIILTTLFSLSVLSQINTQPKVLLPSGKGTSIVYVNGQANLKKDALKTRKLISKQIKSNNLREKIDFGSNVIVDSVFNETFGKNEDGVETLDFLESAALLLVDKFESLSIDQAWSLVYQSVLRAPALAQIYLDGKLTVLKPDIQEEVKLLSKSGILKLRQSTLDVTDSLKVKTMTIMRSERNVIIVSHSQGNLFANVALQQLKNENPMFVPGNPDEGRFLGALHRVGHFQVATPAREFEVSTSEYLINSNDAILDAAKFESNYNLDLPPIASETRGEIERDNNHGMILTYLNGLSYVGNDLKGLRDTFYQKIINVSAKLGEGNQLTCPGGIFKGFINGNGDFTRDQNLGCLEFNGAFLEGRISISTNSCPFRNEIGSTDPAYLSLDYIYINGNGSIVSITNASGDIQDTPNIYGAFLGTFDRGEGQSLLFSYDYNIQTSFPDQQGPLTTHIEEGAFECVTYESSQSMM